MVKYCVLGNGIEGKYGAHIYLAFLCNNQRTPVMIWNGPSLYKTSGSDVKIDEIDRYFWAFECTNTMWFYEFLKAVPADGTLTFELVNAEYRKHHGGTGVIAPR